MKSSSSLIPWTCGLSLAAMLGFGVNHWFAVRDLVATAAHTTPGERKAIPAQAAPVNQVPASPAVAPASPAAAPEASTPAVAQNNSKSSGSTVSLETKEQREFFSMLVDKMTALERQNQDLRDQIAETNRDLINIQFRQDTQSQQFRPLKITNETPTSDNGDGTPGVLPPRAIVPGGDLPRN